MLSIYDNHRAPHPSSTADWDRMCRTVDNPRPGTDKHSQPALLPSLAPGKTLEAVLTHDKMTAIWADVDTHTALADLRERTQAVIPGQAYAIYSTFSSTPNNLRWRVVIPLAEGVPVDVWVDFAAALAQAIGGDTCAARPQQVFYAPRIPPNGCYQSHIQRGAFLETDAPTPLAEMAAETREQIRQDEQRRQRQARKPIRQGRGESPIEAFNAANSITGLLARYGYTQRGNSDHWRSPLQSSGTYATRDYGDRWISLSGSDANAGLGRLCKSGRSGDAFDLYRFYEHHNNHHNAISAVGEEQKKGAVGSGP